MLFCRMWNRKIRDIQNSSLHYVHSIFKGISLINSFSLRNDNSYQHDTVCIHVLIIIKHEIKEKLKAVCGNKSKVWWRVEIDRNRQTNTSSKERDHLGYFVAWCSPTSLPQFFTFLSPHPHILPSPRLSLFLSFSHSLSHSLIFLFWTIQFNTNPVFSFISCSCS